MGGVDGAITKAGAGGAGGGGFVPASGGSAQSTGGSANGGGPMNAGGADVITDDAGTTVEPMPDAGAGTGVSALSSCALEFPYHDEPSLGSWLGGDSAYSLLLTPTTALWSFQDTFVGKLGQAARMGAPLIANSFALVTCNGGAATIHYAWGTSNGGPRAIFSDGTPNQRFWPQQPFLYQGTLFAAMTRVQGAAMEIGTAMARVDNPMDPPGQWKVSYADLASISGLGKGTVLVGDYAYLFGNVGTAIATRLPLKELVKPGAVPTALLQYLANDGTWRAGLVTSDAKKLGFSANVGTSFRYLDKSARWLVLFTNTSGWPSSDISISTAPALEGPWSRPVNVYRVPEMTPGTPDYDVDNVCYAAIEHTESNPDPETELLFSYTCNSTVFSKQLANMNIYVPKIVKIKNPAP
jgi:hypothetical protein